MAIAIEIASMERELVAAGRTVKALCDEAGVNQSTWTRWKAESNAPNMTTWQKVLEAHQRLTSQPHQGAA